jgi:xylulokinase
VLAVGGGVRNGPWAQATSDQTGLTQTVAQVGTGAALGDAFLAALAVGAVTMDDITRWNPPARTIAPRSDPAHDAAYAIFTDLYARTKGLMHRL